MCLRLRYTSRPHGPLHGTHLTARQVGSSAAWANRPVSAIRHLSVADTDR